ncbi:hypothetical protein [Marivirga sp.]|uniref:hypothetical protein n=1 Tax=Marivirga sp. TaxID=2018662 RepID=UPI0025E0E6CE|nr:hypothetical protein [Marivirga sp.]
MRLAQAARKLSITTEDIVDFLEIRGMTVEKDSNTKLEERAVQLLYKHFDIEEDSKLKGVEPKEDIGTIEIKEEEQTIPEIDLPKSEGQKEDVTESQEIEETEIESEENLVEEKPNNKLFKTVDELLEGESDNSSDDFVIKAPKVELKGLNIVGKIDLPEPKPKPEVEQKEESKVNRRKKSHLKTREDRKPPKKRQKRELTPTEIRKREEQKEARKRERVEKEKKKKREQFYREKILKPKQIEQKNKLKKRKSSAVETGSEQKPQPKTVLGKFWLWLNT